MVGGLGGLVRLGNTSGGVDGDGGVRVSLSLGETEADKGALFMDDERAQVTCVS